LQQHGVCRHAQTKRREYGRRKGEMMRRDGGKTYASYAMDYRLTIITPPPARLPLYQNFF